jgi:hypothetical protein
MQPNYAMAYIQLIDANTNGLNTMQTVPFKRNAGLGPVSSPFEANLQLRGKDRPGFWAYSVVFGYQDDSTEDGEPDTEEPNLGINADDLATTTLDGFCVIYLEGIRDKVWGLNRGLTVNSSDFTNATLAAFHKTTYLERVYGTIIHEVGHAPRQVGITIFDHSEGGLMQPGAGPPSLGFTPATIRRLRSADKWTP